MNTSTVPFEIRTYAKVWASAAGCDAHPLPQQLTVRGCAVPVGDALPERHVLPPGCAPASSWGFVLLCCPGWQTQTSIRAALVKGRLPLYSYIRGGNSLRQKLPISTPLVVRMMPNTSFSGASDWQLTNSAPPPALCVLAPQQACVLTSLPAQTSRWACTWGMRSWCAQRLPAGHPSLLLPTTTMPRLHCGTA